MKSLISLVLAAFMVLLYACSGNKADQAIKDIDSQVDSIHAKSQNLEQKTYQNPENSEIIKGYYAKNGKPIMLSFDSYPDFVQYYYNNGLVCIVHNVIGEGSVSGSESRYYFKDNKLFYYIIDKQVTEITPEIEKAATELLGIEAEYLLSLKNNGKITGQVETKSTIGNLDFLNEFVDKPSYDVSENDQLTLRLKAIMKGEGDFGNLIAQLAYGDAIQKFDNAIIINGQARQVIDEEGNQVTFVSIIVADLANNVLSVGMTDEEGNTSVFYTEAPGQKYPKQLVDWFTQDYRNTFKMEAQ